MTLHLQRHVYVGLEFKKHLNKNYKA